MNKSKLRIGLFLDGYTVSAWTLQMLERLVNSECCEISLVVLNNNEKAPLQNKSLYSKLINNRGRIGSLLVRKCLDAAYKTLIERNTYTRDSHEDKNCEDILNNCRLLKVKTNQKKCSDYFYEDDIDEIRKDNIDIFIRCGFGILRGDILNVAKYGVWSFHHGDNCYNRGGPAGYWESMYGWSETGSILQILTEDLDNGKVLYRSFSCTDPLSIQDNRSNYYWKSLSFLPRKIQELYDTGEEQFFAKVEFENRHPVFYSERLYTKPTNVEVFKLLLKKIKDKCKKILTYKLYLEQWILMFHFNNEFSSSLWRYKKIIPPKDRFWADPHVVFEDNKYYIFIEEYLYKIKKGHLAYMCINEKGEYSDPVKIIDKPYHLSYPFTFKYEGDYYMVPESIANRTIDLYKCIEFPDKWEFQMSLMDNIKGVDATLLFHNEKWWMFVNVVENLGASAHDELFLYYSTELLTTDWKAHAQNPIVSDCKSARSAGKIFIEDGRLYRPSQNCSGRYGHGFNLSEILTLTETNYAEEIVSRVKPNWDKDIVGTHTFSRDKSLHVIDALNRRWR